MEMAPIRIETLHKAEGRDLDDINRLLPQISAAGIPLTREAFEQVLAQPGDLIVARDGGQIVGLLCLVVNPIPTKVKGWIEDLVVDQGYRGRGIARQLVEWAIVRARELGCLHLNLTMQFQRGAGAFYEKQGFKRRDSQLYRLYL